MSGVFLFSVEFMVVIFHLLLQLISLPVYRSPSSLIYTIAVVCY